MYRSVLLAVLLCPAAFASDCGDACLTSEQLSDDASLMQVKQVVKHGIDRMDGPTDDAASASEGNAVLSTADENKATVDAWLARDAGTPAPTAAQDVIEGSEDDDVEAEDEAAVDEEAEDQEAEDQEAEDEEADDEEAEDEDAEDEEDEDEEAEAEAGDLIDGDGRGVGTALAWGDFEEGESGGKGKGKGGKGKGGKGYAEGGRLETTFETNMDKIKSQIEAEAADQIDFVDSQMTARGEADEKADEAVKANEDAVAEQQAEEEEEVQEVSDKRQEVKDAADAKVKAAKERAEARYIERKQSEDAAALGRKAGEIVGDDAQAHAWSDYQTEVENKEDQKERASERKQIAADEAADRAAVRADTAENQKEDQAIEAEQASEDALEEADASANAADEEESITGAEGMNNKISDVQADWAVKSYDRRTDSSQDTIDDAASAEYPAGDWPVGPGDSPAAAAVKSEEAWAAGVSR